jgi:hypothetical protein
MGGQATNLQVHKLSDFSLIGLDLITSYIESNGRLEAECCWVGVLGASQKPDGKLELNPRYISIVTLLGSSRSKGYLR